jgi:sterol desaturase/sphingolipid hydroxylase (fatty acid hydroxylase superfamily)
MIAKVAVALSLGCFTWSFLEYCIHRWLGHDKRYRGNIFDREHTRHHVEGDYFATWWKKAVAAVAFLALASGPAVLIVDPFVGVAWAVGLVGAYLFYELLHRRLHVHRGFFGYGRWARRHHFYHHFVDARANFGVTTPLWDHVFGTHQTAEVITVPRKLIMPWLGDPETGVRPEFRDTFALKMPAPPR